MTGHPLLALADVHRVTTRLGGRERDVFVFDHHRSAFAIWCWASQQAGPLALLSLDRHMDLERPAAPPPSAVEPLEALDAYARFRLSPRNDDHVLAAVEAGALTDAAIVARSHAPADLAALHPYKDARGGSHRFTFARTLDEAVPALLDFVNDHERIALDVDLDCLTTLSDAHPDEVVPWDVEHVDAFLRPPDSEALWSALFDRVALVTIAREPYHCGGLGRGARLWTAFAEVFFRRLLGVPEP